MSGVLHLVETQGDEARTRRSAVPVSAAVSALMAGEGPVGVIERLGLDPAELVAVLAFEALGPDGSEGPELVQGQPPRPWVVQALEESAWSRLLPAVSRPVRLSLAAGLLQIFDAWDESHTAAQQADDLGERAFSAYWHGIAHRREPDSGNATYWFRRVGRHPLFPALGSAARTLAIVCEHPEIGERVAPESVWNPFAFIDFCTKGSTARGLPLLARKLQRLEMMQLLEATSAAAGLA